jgi:phospholipid/cholesterol/gamma-HCH transport system substrate-binding protein
VKLSREFKVGLLVTSAIALLYIGFNFLKGISVFSKTATYYAVYENIDGLTVSNPVVVNGLNVGRVSRIQLVQNDVNLVVVEIQVGSDLKLGDSTRALLINSDFLGSKAIQLEIGSIDRPLESGDTLIATVDPSITEFLMQKALPVANSIDILIRNVNKLVDEFAGNGERIDLIMENALQTSEVAKEMAIENRRNIQIITRNISEITSELNIASKELVPLLAKMDQVADSLAAISVSESIAKVNKNLDELHRFIAMLNSSEGTVNQLMTDKELYTNLTRSAADLDSLLVDLRKNPKKYVHFSLFGKK